MGQYAIKRLGQMIPVLGLVSIAIFLIIHLIPGDPAQIIAGPNATDEQLAALNTQFGLDQPLWQQYVIWLKNVLTGNLGNSFLNNYPVNQLIGQAIPATLELAVAALIIGMLIAVPVGLGSALRPGSWFDLTGAIFSALALAMPTFWLAMLFILLFSLWLRWLPPSGRPDFGEQPIEYFKALAMPALTLGIVLAATLTRYLRSAMLEVLQQDYTRTARGKGLPEQAVIIGHVLRNALIPVITVLGLLAGDLLSGAIIVESIFTWPGVGRLTVQAIGWRDYALLQANVLYIVLAFLLVSWLTDLAYGWADPRIRYK